MNHHAHAVVTLSFTRPVRAHELQPGDLFAFTDAPSSPLAVTSTAQIQVTADLALVVLALDGQAEPLHLPSNTPLKALRMIRTVGLPCLLCGKQQDVDLDLPVDGEPLSLVCADHTSGPAPDDDADPNAEGA
ncbi:hypothetical protein ACIQVL_04945 [Streptomyces sp. NPDC090499]|uniref:hypothetical protein n=1 Tax=Streptomyces sp. NPDC090499 TaxID=3365965 RepID=UPI0038275AAC